jgi:hypothetical protein
MTKQKIAQKKRFCDFVRALIGRLCLTSVPFLYIRTLQGHFTCSRMSGSIETRIEELRLFYTCTAIFSEIKGIMPSDLINLSVLVDLAPLFLDSS